MNFFKETALDGDSHRKLTKLAFLDRFSIEEQSAIYAAESTNPKIKALLEQIRAAVPDPGTDKAIDLNDTRIADALASLADAGLIGKERPAEILAG